VIVSLSWVVEAMGGYFSVCNACPLRRLSYNLLFHGLEVLNTETPRYLSILNSTVSVLTAIFQTNLVSRHQSVSILDFIGAKDDGGGADNWSCKTYKASVKSSPQTNTQLFAGWIPFLSPN